MNGRWLMNSCLHFYRMNGCKRLDYGIFAKTRHLCRLTAVKVSSKEIHPNKKIKRKSKKMEESLVLNITEEQSKVCQFSFFFYIILFRNK